MAPLPQSSRLPDAASDTEKVSPEHGKSTAITNAVDGTKVYRGKVHIGYVTYAGQGLIAIEVLPVRPRARNWYTAKEFAASGLSLG